MSNAPSNKPKSKWLVPELKSNEILTGFKEAGLDWITLEVINKPSAKSVQSFYQWLLITLFRSSSNPCQVPKEIINNLEHQQVYASTLSLLNLYGQCHQLAKNILLLEDFQLRHLTKPDSLSFKKQLCYILYFIKYYNEWHEETFLNHIQPGLEKEELNEKLKSQKEELQAELTSLIVENEENKDSIESTLLEIDDEKVKNSELATQCTELKSENEKLKKDRDEHLKLIKDHYDHKSHLENHINGLQSKIFTNPEEKKKELVQLRNQIEDIKQNCSKIQERKKLIHLIQEYYPQIHKDIDTCKRSGSILIQAKRKFHDEENEENELKQKLDQIKTKKQNMNNDIKLLELKIESVQENLEKSKERLTKRHEILQASLKNAQESQKQRELDDNECKQEIERIQREIEDEKRKGQELLSSFDQGIKQGEDILHLVKKQAKSYQMSLVENLSLPRENN